MHRAKKIVLTEGDMAYDERFQCIAPFLDKVVAENPGSIADTEVDLQGRFKRAFLMLGPSIEVSDLSFSLVVRA
jgi:hypothetical protein